MKILFTNKHLAVTCLGSSDTPEKSCFRLALYSNWAENDQKALCVGFCFQKLGGDLGLCRFLSLFLWVTHLSSLPPLLRSEPIELLLVFEDLHNSPMLYFNFQSTTAVTNKWPCNTISYVIGASLTSTLKYIKKFLNVLFVFYFDILRNQNLQFYIKI